MSVQFEDLCFKQIFTTAIYKLRHEASALDVLYGSATCDLITNWIGSGDSYLMDAFSLL